MTAVATVPATVDCGECAGQGYRWEDVWVRGGHTTREWPCTECDGTGQVAAPEPEDDEAA